MIINYLKSIIIKKKLKKINTIVRLRFIPNSFNIGENCIVGKKAQISTNVEIGNFTYLNSNIKEIIVESNTKIGNYCSIAPGVCIGLGNHYLNIVSTHPFLFNDYYKKSFDNIIEPKLDGLKDKNLETIIESDVWIGANSIINRGITVGQGAVIASGAIVTKNVDPYSIVAGVPAKVIGYRFDKEIVEKLLLNKENSFWNWSKKEIIMNYDLLYNIDDYCKYIENRNQMKKGENLYV
ncbi:MAG: CatB-related O-acetyltransferase [Bacillota bacterium]|nr:CatB-related O-acetyltransferase [Bacillota bacterium]